jgi:hypothetical protein
MALWQDAGLHLAFDSVQVCGWLRPTDGVYAGLTSSGCVGPALRD